MEMISNLESWLTHNKVSEVNIVYTRGIYLVDNKLMMELVTYRKNI